MSATREPVGSAFVHPYCAQISKRDCPVGTGLTACTKKLPIISHFLISMNLMLLNTNARSSSFFDYLAAL